MYCEFYGFREKPFNITPNPRFIFLSKHHREAFAHLLYGIDSHAGFIELTGEVGTGKTTLLRTLFEQLDERGLRTALIFNPCLSAVELMRSINREFGIAWEGLSSSELLEALNLYLLAENSAGRTVVLVIDEAQNLEPQVLEQVRLISNLETKTDKLIQIVLAGQPELRQLLSRSELRQISQRITVTYHLTPLDLEDTKAYLEHRLEVAGDWRAASFTSGAVKKVFSYSRGVPRLINIVCDRALLFGYVAETREISAKMVKSAIAEVRREERGTSILRRWLLFAALALVLIAAGGFAAHDWYRFSPTPKDAPAGSPLSEELLTKEMRKMTEAESSLIALNALTKLWNLPPITAGSGDGSESLKRGRTMSGLTLTRYNGSLGHLVRIGYPALLEFTLPGVDGRRYFALTGIKNARFQIFPSVAERNSLSQAELESFWSGTAYLPWKNFGDIPPLMQPGREGTTAARLQRLLKETGVFEGEITAVLDHATIAAVRKFQAANGITPDGKAGAQTLLLLYRHGKYEVPGLEEKKGKQPG